MSIFGQKKDIGNMVFDWDSYWKNAVNGIDNKVMVGKMENRDYFFSVDDRSYGKNQAAECAK